MAVWPHQPLALCTNHHGVTTAQLIAEVTVIRRPDVPPNDRCL